ncbi:MAG: AEC family transporter [Firmicutes bacterium]|nr:AEC family transporter [Bacillota bacterium]
MPDIFSTMLKNITSLFIIMGVGYLCRKIKIIDDAVSAGLSKILLYVALPCTAFMSMMREFSYTLLGESMVTLSAALVIFLFGTLLGAVFTKLDKSGPRRGSVWKFALTFPNVGYAGFPIMLAVYGQPGQIYTAMVNAAFSILAYSLGMSLFGGAKGTDGSGGKSAAVHWALSAGGDAPADARLTGEQLSPDGPGRSGQAAHNGRVPKKRGAARLILLNPALIATELGFVFFLLSLRPPEVIAGSMTFMSNMTTPLSMLIVGAILAKIDIRSAFTDVRIYFISLMRLAVIPLAAFAVLRLFVANMVMLGVIVYLAAMPVASLTVIMAEERGGDSETSSKAVLVSTLLSMITIPLLSMVLN